MTEADRFATEVRIAATPEAVFPYLTDPALMVRWMGEWADLVPSPGGTFAVDIQGNPVRGEFVAVEPPHRLVFTWGMAGSDVPPGSSTVEITLRPDGDGTVVALVHRDLPPGQVADHGTGWDHYLPRLAEVALTPARDR
ncbi:MAG TPA: SRPBCC domain-containing protein [Acidimicrobiales bacterium]|nr:SRPBCC domain-containing protein [Acidimicrobiales bacterium]